MIINLVISNPALIPKQYYTRLQGLDIVHQYQHSAGSPRSYKMNLSDTPYNHDSKPTQPRELTDAEQSELDQDTMERCERQAAKALLSNDYFDYVSDALDNDYTEIIDACDAVIAWRKDGCKIDERPEAECFMFISLLLDRAEKELYDFLIDREGVEK